MLQGYYYHKTIRKLVAAFGTLFNNIMYMKYDENGAEVERAKVPLSFAQKEKFIYDLAYDVTLTKPISVQLPRMSFELVGYQYDSTRKLPTINKVLNRNTANNKLLVTNYQPVPYDFSFELNLYTRNIEDMSQIIEQILPYFTPDFTVTIALVQDNITIARDVPFILDSVAPLVQFEGDNNTPRYVTCQMMFTVKAYLFGPSSGSSIIRKAITNIFDTVGDPIQINTVVDLSGKGNYLFEEEVYSGNSWINATWAGRVYHWGNTTGRLDLYSVHGKKFPETGDLVVGIDSGAQFIISTTNRAPLKHAQIIIEPKPNTANIGSANSFSTVVTEFPNIPGG